MSSGLQNLRGSCQPLDTIAHAWQLPACLESFSLQWVSVIECRHIEPLQEAMLHLRGCPRSLWKICSAEGRGRKRTACLRQWR
jgi:hypothetical protein